MLKGRAWNTQAEWENAWNNYGWKTRAEIAELAERTKEEMLEVTQGKKCGYAYSGGKDSVALALLCEDIGITTGVCAVSSLFFDCSLEHIKRTLPTGVEMVDTGQTIEWLFENQDTMLFPDNMYKWYLIGHLAAQEKFYKEKDLDLMLKGKRWQDGNNISKELIRTSRNGMNEYNPIRAWKHEDVIAFMRYRGKTLSPFYWTKYGFHFGDVEWPSMNMQKGETIYDMWEYVYSVEPDKVYAAAKGIESAKEFLRRKTL